MQFSSDPPPEGWCQHYLSHHAIDSCGAQVNRIDTYDGVIWFVLAAWSEAKQWCGTEFGLGSFDPASFEFTDYGPCYPDEGLEIPTDGWPGPGEGTAFVTTTADWDGNLIPVYYFCGYAYAEDFLPLSPDPATGFGGTSNCLSPPESWSADAYGGMGLFTDGVYACPEGGILGGGSGGGLGPQGSDEAVCCFEEHCRVTTHENCAAACGDFYPEWLDCDPNPCSGPPSGGRQVRTVCPEGAMYSTIQQAIDEAEDGDIIQLCCDYWLPFTGDGNADIAVPDKMITIISECDDPDRCIVDCNGTEMRPHRGFVFHPASGLDSRRLRSVTIQHGYSPG